MADMLLGSAQGAVGSLLGRLTSALIDEAQQLSGVRGDVQFIKDEMESMHGFLLHFAEATGDGGEEEDHRVRAWMKQVAEVAYASQNCVDLYVQSLGAGAGSYLRRLPRLLWTLPARHRIARQIRELKVRAREVGERRMRYGVEAPKESKPKPAKASSSLAAEDDGDKELQDARRRASAEFKPATLSLEQFSREVWKKMTVEIADHKEAEAAAPRVIAILGDPDIRTNFATKAKAWEDWGCMVWIEVGPFCTPGRLLRSIMEKLSATTVPDKLEAWGEKLVEKVRLHLKHKRFLVVLDDFWDRDGTLWDSVKSCFPPGDCTPGSKIIITTWYLQDKSSVHVPSEVEVRYDLSSLRSDHHKKLVDSYLEEAISLVNSNNNQTTDLRPVLRDIISILIDAIPTCSFFLHVLYGNPNRTIDEFQRLREKLGSASNKAKQVLKFAYDGLSSNCKSCLLHLSIFPSKTTVGYAAERLAIFKRARLVRRWIAEGRVKKRGRLMSAMDEADHCFDVLVAHGFVIPKDTDVTGKVKSCWMNDLIHDLIAEIVREETRVNIKLPPDLAHLLSMSHEFQLPQAVQQVHATRSNTTTMFLEVLPSSANLIGLEVLDLENCKELRDHHLKNICNHVVMLKYLSIRNTDITKLPKKIGKLQFLETLDIRQTEVRAFAKRYTVLPKLKHLLAGNQPTDYISFPKPKLQYQETDVRQTKLRVFTKRSIELPKLEHLLSGDQPTGYISEGSTRKPFFTVLMPHCIGAMTELQVLSHIAVSKNASELTGICNLIHLRKLGVVLQDPEGRAFMHLYHAIGNLTRSLVSLSIRIIANNVNADMGMEELLIPPKYLQTLEISGLMNGLPPWVEKLKELTKITLHKTPLSPADIKILGMLTGLRYLRLQEKSSSERTLAFSKDGFQSLVFLVIEFSDIRSISFADEATTTQLQKIVWSSSIGQLSLSGIEHLQNIREVNLKGNFDLGRVEKAIDANKNKPILKAGTKAAGGMEGARAPH